MFGTTSSGKPSFSSIMEEKHFGCMGKTSNTKANDKIVSKDFINREICSNDFSECPELECELKFPLDKQTAPATENTKMNLEVIKPVDETFNMQNNHKSENIDSDFKYNNEDNDSDYSISSKISVTKLPNSSIDDNLPSTVTVLRTPEGGKCYLVGTAHFSVESQNDVSKTIQTVQPNVVMVELCVDRIHVLEMDEETVLYESQDINLNKIINMIKINGVYKGLFYLLFLNVSAHFTKSLGLAPGGEFRRAFIEAKKIPNCHIHMGDRPIKITFARAFAFLTLWQKIKLTWTLLTEKNLISENDVESYKHKDALQEILGDLAEEYPGLDEVFVKERDIYLAYSLQIACRPKIGRYGEIVPAKVVGVVGIGHTLGIIQNWGKVTKDDLPPIMCIPPPSLTSKVLSYTIKATVVGSIIYMGYKIIPTSIGLIMSLKSSLAGLIMVSTENGLSIIRKPS